MTSGLTRREVIAALLGAPALAAIGCGKRTLPSRGSLLAPDHKFGHRLRDGAKLNAPQKTHSHDVVIVGGGIAGLAAGWRLHRAGFQDFVVLELEQETGGTARSGRSDVIKYPWGAHYVPVPTRENPGLIALFEQMGVLDGVDARGNPTAAEQVLCRDPQERVFVDGAWFEGLYPHSGASSDDLREFAEFKAEMNRIAALRTAEGQRHFTIPVAQAADTTELRELDRQSMGQWLRSKGWTSKRLWWYVDYACRDDYGLTASQTSAWAGIFYFVARLPEPSQPSQPFMTWPEGNGRIVSHLSQRLTKAVRTGFLVARVEQRSGGAAVTAFNSRDDTVEQFDARRVVFAAPQFIASHVVNGLRDAQPWRGRGFEYGSWMVANLHLSDRPRQKTGFPLSWDNVLFDSRSLGYVVATHQRGMDHGPTVFTWYYPFCDDDAAAQRQLMLDMDWAEWADVVLADLEQAHPEIRSLVEQLDIMRWGHAMIRPRPGFVFSEPRVRAAEPFGPVHFAGTDLSAVALMEEAWYHGLRAAEEVLSGLDVSFQPLVNV